MYMVRKLVSKSVLIVHRDTTRRKTPLYCIPGDASEQPFNTIAMDLITQLLKANGKDAQEQPSFSPATQPLLVKE
jgi:hypothetical protein